MFEWFKWLFRTRKIVETIFEKNISFVRARERIKGRESELAETGRNIFPRQISPQLNFTRPRRFTIR